MSEDILEGPEFTETPDSTVTPEFTLELEPTEVLEPTIIDEKPKDPSFLEVAQLIQEIYLQVQIETIPPSHEVAQVMHRVREFQKQLNQRILEIEKTFPPKPSSVDYFKSAFSSDKRAQVFSYREALGKRTELLDQSTKLTELRKKFAITLRRQLLNAISASDPEVRDLYSLISQYNWLKAELNIIETTSPNLKNIRKDIANVIDIANIDKTFKIPLTNPKITDLQCLKAIKLRIQLRLKELNNLLERKIANAVIPYYPYVEAPEKLTLDQ